MSPGSQARPERCWARWSSAFASRSATHIPYAVRPGRAASLRPGPMGVARGDGEAPHHLAGDTGAPTADATPGVPDRTENITHTPPAMPTDRRTVHSIVPMFAKAACVHSSCEPSVHFRHAIAADAETTAADRTPMSLPRPPWLTVSTRGRAHCPVAPAPTSAAQLPRAISYEICPCAP